VFKCLHSVELLNTSKDLLSLSTQSWVFQPGCTALLKIIFQCSGAAGRYRKTMHQILFTSSH